MRRIDYSTRFRRDLKREMKGRHGTTLAAELTIILEVLVADAPLAVRHQDHALIGDWTGYRDCHVKPDLVLIYGKQLDGLLRLARLGSHAEVFG